MQEGWKTYKLGDIGKVQTGPFGSQLHQKDYVKIGTPLITVKNIGVNRITYNSLDHVKDEDVKRLKKFILKEDDIVFSRVGYVDRCAIVREKEIGWLFSGSCLRLRILADNVDSMFVSYLMSSSDFKNYIVNHSVGATRPSLNTKLLSNAPIIIPPLQEQKAIASILSALDDKIENNLAMNKTLEDMAMALYKHWFVDFGPFQDGEFVDSELGEIPMGWEVSSLEKLLILQRGFDLPKTKRIEGSFSVFASSGRSTTHNQKKVNGPGIVTGRSGVIGNVYFINEDFWPLNTTLWVKKYLNSNPYHSYFLLQNINLKEYNSGSAVPTLNRNDVHRLRVIKPPMSIILDFTKVIKQHFELQYENYNTKQTLTTLRDTLLPKLISGEVRVKDAEKIIAEVL